MDRAERVSDLGLKVAQELLLSWCSCVGDSLVMRVVVEKLWRMVELLDGCG